MDIRDLKFMLSQFAASDVPDTTEIIIVDAEGYGASPAAALPQLALYSGNMNNRGRIYATPQQRKAAGLPAELDVDAPEGSELVVFLNPVADSCSESEDATCLATFREDPMPDAVYCGERGPHSRHAASEGSNYYAWLDSDEGAGWDPLQ